MNVGLFVNLGKAGARTFVPGLVQWLAENGHRPMVSAAVCRRLRLSLRGTSDERLVHRSDLVVALGGDGTLLRAARLVGSRGTPVMGINLGGLGFLTAFSVEEARDGIVAVAGGRHVVEERVVLAVRYGRRTGFVLNDCSVNMCEENRVIELVARAGGEFLTRFVGDGVVVSTPTGSTAYSLAAGGPVVYPTMDAVLITPLCPHALSSRPVILPGDTEIELTLSPRTGSAVINLDGQERWQLVPGRPLRIRRARHRVKLVTPRGKTYFQILRDKLHWAGSQH